ncbi:MAG TPA: AraC family transcriptional regulator, partial [Brevundimonas sp.]|nr:AraC family transcriptional regulator [Brevundimonas sp.]
PGLRLPGDWIDDGAEAPSDRLDDETLADRAEAWRPWRAYGALHLALAGISGADLKRMESDDAKRAA